MNKKLILIRGAVLICLGVIFLIFFIRKDDNLDNHQLDKLSVLDKDRFITDLDIGNYKIFSDKLLNFQFQYPEDWSYRVEYKNNDLNQYSLIFNVPTGNELEISPYNFLLEGIACYKDNVVCERRTLLLDDKKVVFVRPDNFFAYSFYNILDGQQILSVSGQGVDIDFLSRVDRLVRSFKFCSYDQNQCNYLSDDQIENVEKDVLSALDLNIDNWVTYSTNFGFSFKIPKDVVVLESKDKKIVSLKFRGIKVMNFYTSFERKEPNDKVLDVDWTKIKILESFKVNGEVVDLVTHDQSDRNADWMFPSECSYYIFKNHSDIKNEFQVSVCVRETYVKEFIRKVVESVRFN